MGILKQLLCGHETIRIVGIRADMSAVYECDRCGRFVEPHKSRKTYHPVKYGGSS